MASAPPAPDQAPAPAMTSSAPALDPVPAMASVRPAPSPSPSSAPPAVEVKEEEERSWPAPMSWPPTRCTACSGAWAPWATTSSPPPTWGSTSCSTPRSSSRSRRSPSGCASGPSSTPSWCARASPRTRSSSASSYTTTWSSIPLSSSSSRPRRRRRSCCSHLLLRRWICARFRRSRMCLLTRAAFSICYLQVFALLAQGTSTCHHLALSLIEHWLLHRRILDLIYLDWFRCLWYYGRLDLIHFHSV
ncbi:hypothetical protein BS78_01G268100 [Paspalum vaginatum]|nr:hypothetical protein BS78_01G268100 [Paspalum vaginatum]